MANRFPQSDEQRTGSHCRSHLGCKNKATEKAARDRAKKFADMAADPTSTILETERLIANRSGDTYEQIAKLLAELREATTGSSQSGIATQQAIKLTKKYTTLRLLVSGLWKEGRIRTEIGWDSSCHKWYCCRRASEGLGTALASTSSKPARFDSATA